MWRSREQLARRFARSHAPARERHLRRAATHHQRCRGRPMCLPALPSHLSAHRMARWGVAAHQWDTTRSGDSLTPSLIRRPSAADLYPNGSPAARRRIGQNRSFEGDPLLCRDTPRRWFAGAAPRTPPRVNRPPRPPAGGCTPRPRNDGRARFERLAARPLWPRRCGARAGAPPGETGAP